MISSVSSTNRAVVHDRPQQSGHITPLEIRKAEPNDVPQIPALFEKVYGGSYGNRGVYSAEYFTEKLRKGELVSIVAVSPDGRVIGHCALLKENDRAEIAMASMSVVDLSFRNMECESRMLAAVIQEARHGFLRGVASQSVTHHVFAQKAGQKFGFKRIGLQVGVVSDRRTYDGKRPAPGRRMSVALGYLPLRSGPKTPIYAPGHHRDFIGMLFKEAGLNRNFLRPEKNDRILTGRASLRLSLITNDVAKITIDRYGTAVFRCVEELLRDLRVRDIRYISMDLPLGSPFTATACSEFEQLGFFITGIMPHSSIGDALILQFTNNARVDYDDILVASETLADIKSYVRSHDPNR
jgi:hypothetical protein